MKKIFTKNGNILVIFALLISLGGCGGGGSTAATTTTTVPPPSSVGAIPSLSLGAPATNGNVITFPLVIANSQGRSVSGIEANIKFDSGIFALIMNGNNVASVVADDAVTQAGKRIDQIKSSTISDVLQISIIDLGGKKSIADGVIAQISFSIVSGATVSTNSFAIVPTATDSSGVPITITGTP